MAVHGPYTVIRYKLVRGGTPLYQEHARVEVRSKADARKRQHEFLAEDGCWPDIIDTQGNYLDLED